MLLGYYRQKNLLVFFLIFTAAATAQQPGEHKYHVGTGLHKTIISSSENSLVINYSISELDARSFIDNNGRWFRIGIPGHIPSADPGKPEMPVLSRLILIPEGYSSRIKITEVKSIKVKPSGEKIMGDLFPVQEGETKEMQQERPPFRMDKAVYASRRLIQSDTVRIEPLGKVRGRNLATLSISPARYNPRKKILEVITSMKIEVIFIATGATKKSLVPESLLIGDNLEKGTLNYTPEDLITGYSDKPVRMIILTDTAFRKQLKPFIEWKTQKGFRLDILYKGAAYAGENYADIKNSIAAIYNSSTSDNPPPEYLLIIGSTDRIPYYGTGNVTDLYYGEFDGGGDYIPDMYIGRLPVSDTSDLRSVVSKLIQYEKFEFADTNHFQANALATAGVDDGHSNYMNGQVNYGVTNYLNASNNINGYKLLYPNAKKDTIIKLINKGLSLINYTGHGTTTGWLYLNISNSDVPLLTNKNMYPFVISNACQTSRFNTASFGNSMVLEKDKGAIGYIGCSADSYWDEDYYWAVGVGPVALEPTYESTGLGALDRLFHTHGESASEWYVTMGQVNFAGNLSVSSSTTSKKKYYWEIYNLVGDPSVTPITGTPGKFSFSLPDTLPNNLTSLSFVADPFSYIAVSHFDTLWDASYVSPSGSVTLEMPGLSNDSCLFVVTGQNRVPVIKKVYFSTISKPYLNLSGSAINDSLGNNDGKADYNETLFLRLTVNNLGAVAAPGAKAALTSSSPYVTIVDGSADLGTLLPGAQKILFNDLKLSLSGNIPDKAGIPLDIKLTYGSVEKLYKTDLEVHSPDLTISHYLIDDTETGNGNFIADPGESVKFIFSILNKGSSSTSGLFTISSPDPEISIVESSKNSGTLNAGEVTEIPLQAKISTSAAEGSTVSLAAELTCDPYYSGNAFRFRIGRFQETFESASFRIFPWINISPRPWTLIQTSPYEGDYAARSGVIGDNQSSVLAIKAKYSADDSVRFYYKVSSEAGYDNFLVKVNDVEVLRKSGDIAWTRAAVAVKAGINIIEWIYRKDGSIAAGADCALIDLVDFAGAAPVRYIARDIYSAKLVSPVQSATMGFENVTVRLLNLGPDTIRGFNMAYTINSEMPVVEHFSNNLIYAGDTVTVTFTKKVDFSSYGDYDLVVYSFDNNDDNLLNDTLRINLKNRVRRIGENERINEKNAIFFGPNPFLDELNLYILSENEDTVHVSLISTQGRAVIGRKEHHLLSGTNLVQIDGSMLEPAVYYLVIDYGGHSRSIKVVRVNNK